jgi:glycosyltransferase involved in cell wall biosynthesis
MNRRILHILSADHSSSAEKQLQLLVQGLPRDEFENQICVLDGAGGRRAVSAKGANRHLPTSSSTSVPTNVVSTRWTFDPRSVWELKSLVDRFSPHLIQSWASEADLYALAVAKTTGRKQFIIGCDCIDPYKSGAQLAIERYIGRHCSCMIAKSAEVRDFYIQKGMPAERLQVIPAGVEQPQSASTRRQLLAELGLNDNDYLIGIVTGLLLRNRVKDAIWAADLIKVVRKDVHLLIIGDGPHGDELRRFRDQVRIADFVHFLGRRGDLVRLVPHFDLLWVTSPYEDSSVAILDAMAAGVPVVACDAPGTRDIVLHRQTGFLVPVGDRAAYARHAYQILEDPALSRRLADAASERARSEFSSKGMISAYIDVYRQLLQ